MPFNSQSSLCNIAVIAIWLSTIFGLALGAFSGGVVGTRILREKNAWITGAIGLLLSPWAFYTFYIVFLAVLWVPILMLISAFLFSYLGGVMITKYQPSSKA